MTFIDQIRRIERIDYHIRTRSTGTPAQFARKLGMSQSQLFQIMKIMREIMDAPVYYSKTEQSYCYEENVKFFWGFMSDNRYGKIK